MNQQDKGKVETMCCNKKHSLVDTLRCIKEKGHEGWCSCVPTRESALIEKCRQLIVELNKYETSSDEMEYDIFHTLSSVESLMHILKEKELKEE